MEDPSTLLQLDENANAAVASKHTSMTALAECSAADIQKQHVLPIHASDV